MVEVKGVECQAQGSPQQNVKQQHSLVGHQSITVVDHHAQLEVYKSEKYPHKECDRDGDS